MKIKLVAILVLLFSFARAEENCMTGICTQEAEKSLTDQMSVMGKMGLGTKECSKESMSKDPNSVCECHKKIEVGGVINKEEYLKKNKKIAFESMKAFISDFFMRGILDLHVGRSLGKGENSGKIASCQTYKLSLSELKKRAVCQNRDTEIKSFFEYLKPMSAESALASFISGLNADLFSIAKSKPGSDGKTCISFVDFHRAKMVPPRVVFVEIQSALDWMKDNQNLIKSATRSGENLFDMIDRLKKTEKGSNEIMDNLMSLVEVSRKYPKFNIVVSDGENFQDFLSSGPTFSDDVAIGKYIDVAASKLGNLQDVCEKNIEKMAALICQASADFVVDPIAQPFEEFNDLSLYNKFVCQNVSKNIEEPSRGIVRKIVLQTPDASAMIRNFSSELDRFLDFNEQVCKELCSKQGSGQACSSRESIISWWETNCKGQTRKKRWEQTVSTGAEGKNNPLCNKEVGLVSLYEYKKGLVESGIEDVRENKLSRGDSLASNSNTSSSVRQSDKNDHNDYWLVPFITKQPDGAPAAAAPVADSLAGRLEAVEGKSTSSGESSRGPKITSDSQVEEHYKQYAPARAQPSASNFSSIGGGSSIIGSSVGQSGSNVASTDNSTEERQGFAKREAAERIGDSIYDKMLDIANGNNQAKIKDLEGQIASQKEKQNSAKVKELEADLASMKAKQAELDAEIAEAKRRPLWGGDSGKPFVARQDRYYDVDDWDRNPPTNYKNDSIVKRGASSSPKSNGNVGNTPTYAQPGQSSGGSSSSLNVRQENYTDEARKLPERVGRKKEIFAGPPVTKEVAKKALLNYKKYDDGLPKMTVDFNLVNSEGEFNPLAILDSDIIAPGYPFLIVYQDGGTEKTLLGESNFAGDMFTAYKINGTTNNDASFIKKLRQVEEYIKKQARMRARGLNEMLN